MYRSPRGSLGKEADAVSAVTAYAAQAAHFILPVIALIVLVFIIRKKKDDAIVPLNALKDRNTLVLTGSNFLHNFGAMSISFFIPGFIMRTLATDPIVQTIGPALAGGLSTSLMAVLGLFLGPVFGRIIAKQNTAKWL